ncbi:MAG: Oligopeptide transport system permease protein OppC [Candidatus Izimaplasma bacterium HR2]|nr:MAG: Oligopeptide transport system permease protein OppC [Candidatus Izimaplasma bacterium HR2]
MADEKRNLTSEDFRFVQAEEKIYDKKFDTKPIGYFKDAMIRFGKNRSNVIATSILFLIVLGTIIFPLLSTKNYTLVIPEFSNLPPRMPVVENFGLFDGTSFKEDQPVDLSTIDPETGLGFPIGYESEYIVDGTLKNYIKGCTEASELCQAGENVMRVTSNFDYLSIFSEEVLWVTMSQNPVVKININEIIGEDVTLNVLVKPTTSSDYVVIGSITDTDGIGEYTFNFEDAVTGITPSLIGSKIKLQFVSSDVSSYIVFDTVEVYYDSQDEAIYSYSGFELSEFEYDVEDEFSSGTFSRQNGELLLAEFRYDNYGAALSDKEILAFSAVDYYELIDSYGADCQAYDDPNNVDPEGKLFPDACPIKKIIARNESVIVAGEEYYSYNLILNYAEYKGYTETPYFLFGTDMAGRDLFTLLWVATRTSLIIGVIVASINISVGIVYGSISGYYGGKTDIIMQRFAEVIGRIPWLVTLSIFVALYGPGITTLILILIVSGWIGVASITRTQFYRYKGREYVLASRTLGAKDSRLIFRHILPNGIGTIITSSILTIPYVIFAESTISYLGYGIGHGQSFNILGVKLSGVSVGVLLSDGRAELASRPYLTLFPALLISILMITFNMFGNALRDAFNPALRGSE